MQIIKKTRNFIHSNFKLAFREIYKTRRRKMLLNEKSYKNLAKIAPRVAEKLLWTEEVQTEDPYKIFLFINILNWASWATLFFLFIIFMCYWYGFEPYNQLLWSWFIKFWPKKIIWIYRKWFLNKKEFLTKRAFGFVIAQMLIPFAIINFLYLCFEHFTGNKLHYRLLFFKFLFILLFIFFGILFFDLSYIFFFKNIFWSLELTLQDTPTHVTEVNFIIFDNVDFWFFTIIKFYSFMSYYSVYILLGLCNLLVCIFYSEWCKFFTASIDIDSDKFYQDIERDMEIDEIISDNEDPFDNNK